MNGTLFEMNGKISRDEPNINKSQKMLFSECLNSLNMLWVGDLESHKLSNEPRDKKEHRQWLIMKSVLRRIKKNGY